jgi:mono/diheme cytochrome c family protein
LIRWAAAVLLLLGAGGVRGDDERGEFFERRIRPILVRRCFECHTANRHGGLRVDSRDALLKGGKTGPAVVPGKPEESLMFLAVTHADPEFKMPLGSPRLTDSEIRDIANWIKNGAYWPERAEP